MNNRKSILYFLLIGLGLILGYNYVVAPIFTGYNNRMGMGMHSRMYPNTSYFIDIRYILLIAVVITVLLILEFLNPQAKSNVCSRCGKEIEDIHWKICPICGNSVQSKKG